MVFEFIESDSELSNDCIYVLLLYLYTFSLRIFSLEQPHWHAVEVEPIP